MLTPEGFVQPTTAAPPSSPPRYEALQMVPHSVEAEQSLLGALLIDPAQMINVGYLEPDDFYLVYHGYLYQAMQTLFTRDGNYDYVTLTEHLDSAGHLEDIGGPGKVADMMLVTPTSYGATEYARIIDRHSTSRQVIRATMDITQAAYKNEADRSGDQLVSQAIASLAEIDTTKNLGAGPKPLSSGVSELLDQMEEIERNGKVAGLQTGIKTLDSILGGFEAEKLYLLAGRPGMGKSALALQLAYNIAKSGVGVMFFSFEMSAKAISARLVSLVSGVPYEKFRTPGLGDKWPDILEASDQVAKLPIIVNATGPRSVLAIQSICQKAMLTQDIGLVIVDHGGLVIPDRRTGDSYENNNQNADGLLGLTKSLGCPVLTLLQLNRAIENRANKRPTQADLRDSGKWEENADCILFPYRDEYYNPDTEYPHLCEINVAKNRDGKIGTATVFASMATNRFVDLEMRREAL